MNADRSVSFEAIGTHWTIEYPGMENDAAMLSDVQNAIQDFDLEFSRFRTDSLVSQMAAKAGTYPLSHEFKVLINLYKEFYSATGGKVTPLIGKALEQAGYDKEYRLQPGLIDEVPQWDSVLEVTESEIILKEPALLDFGAAGKGHLVDIVSQILHRYKLEWFCVDAGGDIYVYASNDKNFRIGLEHPDDSSQVIGVATINNQSLCGSAGNRRAWEGYHHILDPQTKRSPRTIKAVWAVAETAQVADMTTTALYLTEPSRLPAHYSVEYLIVYADFSFEKSAQFPVELFISQA